MVQKRFNGVIQSNLPPSTQNVLWVDSSSDYPILKGPRGTSWVPLLGSSTGERSSATIVVNTGTTLIDNPVGTIFDITDWYNSLEYVFTGDYKWKFGKSQHKEVVAKKVSEDTLECTNSHGDYFILKFNLHNGNQDNISPQDVFGIIMVSYGYNDIMDTFIPGDLCICTYYKSVLNSEFNFDPYKYQLLNDSTDYWFDNDTYQENPLYNKGSLKPYSDEYKLSDAINSTIIINYESRIFEGGIIENSKIVCSTISGNYINSNIYASVCNASCMNVDIKNCVLLPTENVFYKTSSGTIKPYSGYFYTLDIQNSRLQGIYGIVPVLFINDGKTLSITDTTCLSNLSLLFNCTDPSISYNYKTDSNQYVLSSAPRIWNSEFGDYKDSGLTILDMQTSLVPSYPVDSNNLPITHCVATQRQFFTVNAYPESNNALLLSLTLPLGGLVTVYDSTN